MLWKRNNIRDDVSYNENIKDIIYTIGSRLRLLRKISGKTIREVSLDISISKQTLGSYERHTRVPGVEILILLADYYGVTVDFILGRNMDEED